MENNGSCVGFARFQKLKAQKPLVMEVSSITIHSCINAILLS